MIKINAPHTLFLNIYGVLRFFHKQLILMIFLSLKNVINLNLIHFQDAFQLGKTKSLKNSKKKWTKVT